MMSQLSNLDSRISRAIRGTCLVFIGGTLVFFRKLPVLRLGPHTDLYLAVALGGILIARGSWLYVKIINTPKRKEAQS